MFRLTCEEVENIAKGGCFTLIKFGVTALVAGNGTVFLILDIEYAGPEPSGDTDFTCFKFFTGTTQTCPLVVSHKILLTKVQNGRYSEKSSQFDSLPPLSRHSLPTYALYQSFFCGIFNTDALIMDSPGSQRYHRLTQSLPRTHCYAVFLSKNHFKSRFTRALEAAF